MAEEVCVMINFCLNFAARRTSRYTFIEVKLGQERTDTIDSDKSYAWNRGWTEKNRVENNRKDCVYLNWKYAKWPDDEGR